MGCFSFLCSGCGKPINSDSFSGEHCKLILLEKGSIIEYMDGQYNSYGQVFKVPTDNLGPHGSEASQEWESMDWSKVCNLMFNADVDSGIAAYHRNCCPADSEEPKVSKSDPDQGWGRYRRTVNGEFKHWKRDQ